TIPANHAPACGNLCREKNNVPAPATAATLTQGAGVRKSHGNTISAVVATKPATIRSAGIHFLCHSGQRRKKGATNNNCPLSIAPAPSKQPHQNQRFFNAASAANK